MNDIEQMEEWRSIPSCPRYFASSSGRVRGPSGKILKGGKDKAGYTHITVYIDGVPYCRMTNRLVCEAFYGPPPTPKHEAAHWDGVKSNNLLNNLRWATPTENHYDKRRHGTHPALEKHPRSQFTEEQIREIRNIYAQNMGNKYVKRGTREMLAIKYKVKVSAIKDILAGRCWGGVT